MYLLEFDEFNEYKWEKRYNFVLIITTTKYNKDKLKNSKLLNWKRFILHKIKNLIIRPNSISDSSYSSLYTEVFRNCVQWE